MKNIFYLVPSCFKLLDSLILIFFILILPTLLSAKTDGSTLLSSKKAIEIAMKSNPKLEQIQARYKAMLQIPSQLASLPDPILSLGAMNFPTDTFDRSQEAMTQVQVGFTQKFPFPGKLDLKEEAAEFEAKSAYFAIDEMRLKLSGLVLITWWQIYYLDRSLETITNNQFLLRQFIEIAKTKYTTGRGLQQDVLLAQLELSKLLNQNIQVKSLRKNQEIKLNIFMGKTPLHTIVLDLNIQKKLKPILNENRLYQMAEESRPILKIKEYKISAASSKLNLAKKDYYPDFQVSFLYGDRIGANPGIDNGSRSDLFSVMLGIKLPLYADTKQSKAIEQKISEKQESTFALIDERLKMMADISKALSDYHQAQEQFILFETGIVPQAKQTVDSMMVGYQVSKVDFLNLVRSQVTLFNYELLYWKALTEAKQAATRIQIAVGKVDIYE